MVAGVTAAERPRVRKVKRMKMNLKIIVEVGVGLYVAEVIVSGIGFMYSRAGELTDVTSGPDEFKSRRNTSRKIRNSHGVLQDLFLVPTYARSIRRKRFH